MRAPGPVTRVEGRGPRTECIGLEGCRVQSEKGRLKNKLSSESGQTSTFACRTVARSSVPGLAAAQSGLVQLGCALLGTQHPCHKEAESWRITRQQWCPTPHASTHVQCTLCSNGTALLMQPELAGWERHILSPGCQEVSPEELKVLQLEQDPSQTRLQHSTSSHIPQISIWGLWGEAQFKHSSKVSRVNS